MKPDKQNIPYLLMDLILKNAEMVRADDVPGKAPSFFLTPTNVLETTNKIRTMIEEAYQNEKE